MSRFQSLRTLLVALPLLAAASTSLAAQERLVIHNQSRRPWRLIPSLLGVVPVSLTQKDGQPVPLAYTPILLEPSGKVTLAFTPGLGEDQPGREFGLPMKVAILNLCDSEGTALCAAAFHVEGKADERPLSLREAWTCQWTVPDQATVEFHGQESVLTIHSDLAQMKKGVPVDLKEGR